MNEQMNNMLKQAQEMQKAMQQQLETLKEMRVIGEAGAGIVKVTLDGNGNVIEVDIDDSVFAEENSKSIIQGLVSSAFNDAQAKRRKLKEEKMKGMLSGLGMPNFDSSMFGSVGD